MTTPRFQAIVVAGGRSRRLGGTPKALLEYEGTSLIARTVAAVQNAGAAGVVVVGPGDLLRPVLTENIRVVREKPDFAGPAAAIGAGFQQLSGAETEAGVTLLLACDMPQVGEALRELLAAVEQHPEYQAWIPQDRHGRKQYLACVVRTKELAASIEAAGDLTGQPVRSLLASLQEYTFTAGSTDDVDTPEDAAGFGIRLERGHE